jgi:hypothetical protein
MYQNNVEMRVLVNGRPTREYSHKGMSFIESRHGTTYSIKLKNDNSFKLKAVLSVDGLNVITGKAAEESDKGYILDPYSMVEIKGYRISDDNSAAFIFTSKGKTYVQHEKSDARNSGVIGVRIFKEKYKAPAPVIHHHHHDQPVPYYVYPWNPYIKTPVYPDPNPIWYSTTTTDHYLNCGGTGSSTFNTTAAYHVNVEGSSTKAKSRAGGCSCTSGNVLKQAIANAKLVHATALDTTKSVSNNFDSPISYKQFDTGTGWGQKLDDKVRKECFESGDLLTEIVMYYSTRDALKNMGLDLTQEPRISEQDDMPKPFNGKYCQPPKDWNG